MRRPRPGRRRLLPHPHEQQRQAPARVIVSWTVADTLISGGDHASRHAIYKDVQKAMTETLHTVLEMLGFPVEPFGMQGVPLLVGLPSPPDAAPAQACANCGRRLEAGLHYPQADGASGV